MWQGFFIAMGTYALTKLIDLAISLAQEGREFRKMRRELALKDIEAIKDLIGTFYELVMSWDSFGNKQKRYAENFADEHKIVGRCNKYPPLGQAATDVVHWCKIVASDEASHADTLRDEKKNLHEKYNFFLEECQSYLNRLV